jgi:hypothetical protein
MAGGMERDPMANEIPNDGDVLGTVRKPPEGWGPAAATRLNDLVRRIAIDHDWRHLVIRMHPATWRQVMPYLNYNLSFPKPGVPMEMDGEPFADTGRIEVAYRDVVKHPY